MATTFCIYCWRTPQEVEFNKEHIIPENIGGKLYIYSSVCKDCNSDLGSQIDIEVLKEPRILDAMNKLQIPHDNKGILNRYYQITAQADGIELKAKANQNGFKILPQELGDGSFIHPEENAEASLRKFVARDTDLSNIPNEEKEKEFNRLWQEYSEASPNEIVESDLLNIKLAKRSSKLKIVYEPMEISNINRTIAKIVYEFLFFMFSYYLFENKEFYDVFINYINSGQNSSKLSVHPYDSENQTFKASHWITLEANEEFTIIYIGLFGSITFLVRTIALPKGIFNKIEEKTENRLIKAIDYQQDIKTTSKRFRVRLQDGTFLIH